MLDRLGINMTPVDRPEVDALLVDHVTSPCSLDPGLLTSPKSIDGTFLPTTT